MRLSWWTQCNHKGPYERGGKSVRGKKRFEDAMLLALQVVEGAMGPRDAGGL